MAKMSIAVKYEIVYSDSTDGLVSSVNELIADGWDPIGGIHLEQGTHVTESEGGHLYQMNCVHCWQAMVKYK